MFSQKPFTSQEPGTDSEKPATTVSEPPPTTVPGEEASSKGTSFRCEGTTSVANSDAASVGPASEPVVARTGRSTPVRYSVNSLTDGLSKITVPDNFVCPPSRVCNWFRNSTAESESSAPDSKKDSSGSTTPWPVMLSTMREISVPMACRSATSSTHSRAIFTRWPASTPEPLLPPARPTALAISSRSGGLYGAAWTYRCQFIGTTPATGGRRGSASRTAVPTSSVMRLSPTCRARCCACRLFAIPRPAQGPH
mmetsp:Transcript_11464/g.32207  ORF Transcript_11464/g.32207 Transcript_11464/m.32207 type:complete len:253 (-) Transcript_11464:587-1345(-)